MDDVTRRAHWERTYSERGPNEVSWFQASPTRSLALIEALSLPSDAWIVDVGGGASVLIDALLDRGFRSITVLDVSPTALAQARSLLGPRAQFVEWVEQDVTRFVAPAPIDVWHDRAVLHFLTEDGDRARYVAALDASVRPGGHVLLGAFAVGGPTR